MVTDYSDGSRSWDGSYEHQSSRGVVHSFMALIKTQGVWSEDEAFAQLMNPDHLAGRWLREQDEPQTVFADLWATAYKNEPKASQEQVVAALVAAVEEAPGLQLWELRAVAAPLGWGNKGRVDGLINGLVEDGTLKDKRTYGPSRTRVTSRRFWKVATATAAVIAKTTSTTVFLGLLALASTDPGIGHRTPGGSRSYTRLMTDKKLRARGLRVLRRRPLRPHRQPPPTPVEHPLLSDFEKRQILSGIEGLDLCCATAPVRAPVLVVAGTGVALRCLL